MLIIQMTFSIELSDSWFELKWKIDLIKENWLSIAAQVRSPGSLMPGKQVPKRLVEQSRADSAGAEASQGFIPEPSWESIGPCPPLNMLIDENDKDNSDKDISCITEGQAPEIPTHNSDEEDLDNQEPNQI